MKNNLRCWVRILFWGDWYGVFVETDDNPSFLQ